MKEGNTDAMQNRRIQQYDGQDDAVSMREINTKEKYSLYSGTSEEDEMTESEIESISDKDNIIINPREPVQKVGLGANPTALFALTLA